MSLTPPQKVLLGYRGFNAKPFIPLPKRCNNCQVFGHTATNCNGTTRCPRCNGPHSFVHCPHKDLDPNLQQNSDYFNCRNCKGKHSSAYHLCPIYMEQRRIIQEKVINKISFAEAA